MKDKRLLTLFCLFMADFILTFIGIDAKVIEEGNPLMLWFVALPVWQALFVRLAMFMIIYLVITTAKKLTVAPTNNKQGFLKPYCRPSFIKWFYRIAFMGNIGVMFLHARWIILSQIYY